MTGAVEFGALMLSYDEPQANRLHARLQHVLRVPVQRLHRVQGMRRAYRMAAEVVDAEQFILADGDFEIAYDFDAGAVAPLADGVAMRVWRARNPLNRLEYGYGGLKLIRRSALREMGEAVDVLAALPGRTEFCAEVAGITRFDQSPYHAWKAAFRECTMLARGSEYGMPSAEVEERLRAWTSECDGQFAEYATAGACEGIDFARESARTPGLVDQINDPGWLMERFDAGRRAIAAAARRAMAAAG
ncbi:hypothetical protein ACQEV4_15005 [Streptomyces shenzhenensis]|uniref:hypothetical protein n=1 Tax=Streptomyces shenzhenensis TaxID=943815 RepID=UPI003D89FAD8